MFSLETFLVHVYMVTLEWFLLYFIYSRYKPMELNVSKKKMIGLFLVTGLIQSFFGAFEYFEINIIVSAIMYISLATLFFDKKRDILFSVVIATAVVDIGESIGAFVFNGAGATRQDIGVFMSESVNTLILFTFARMSSFILVLLLLKFKEIRDLDDDMPTIFWTTFLFLVMKDILLILIIADSPLTISFYYWAAILPIMPLSYVLLFYTRRAIQNMIKTQVDSQVLDAKNRYYEQQVATMKQTLESQKVVRHDLKNKLSPLIYLADTGKTEELVERVTQLGTLNMMGNTYSDSGNITIDYIINLKLQEFDSDDVKVTCDVHVPEELDIAPFDLATVLGNLIDNAIEALSYVEDNKWVTVNLRYEIGYLIIEVANAYDGTIELEDNELKTRKSDSEHHGLGLTSVKTIAEQYEGELKLAYDASRFEAHVKLLT